MQYCISQNNVGHCVNLVIVIISYLLALVLKALNATVDFAIWDLDFHVQTNRTGSIIDYFYPSFFILECLYTYQMINFIEIN